MIDGVMMRLFAADWKATVAVPWQMTTTTMTTRLVARSSAMRQNPGLPYGRGLSQATRPPPITSASTPRTAITTA